jgi:hypothetical protein
MEIPPLLVLRLIFIVLFIITLVIGARSYPKIFGAEAITKDAEASDQRLYNKTQMVSVWVFFVVLFGAMSLIL